MLIKRINLLQETILSRSLKDIPSRNVLLFYYPIVYFSSREKISLFKAHQDRQIQDRMAEDRDILAYNDQRKVTPESKDLTPVEIANFDIYYGRFESVFTQGSGRTRKVIKSLRKYDVELILHNKLGNDFVKIIDFMHARGSNKLKCAEIIFILEFFVKHPQKLAELQENNQIHSIFEVIFTALANVSIYSSKELVRLLKLMVYFGVEREDVWKNLLTKANLLYSNRSELEEAYASVSIVMTIFLNRQFNDLTSKAMVQQLKKKLLRNLDSLDVKDCVRLFVLIAERQMFLDPLQLKNFESRFIANQESLSLNDIADVFDAFVKLNFYSIELTEYFMKYRMNKINEIVPPMRLNNKDRLIGSQDNKISNSQQLVLIEPMEKDQENLQEGQIYLHSYISLLRGFSYTQALTGQENQQIWDIFEDLFCQFLKKHIKPNEMDRIFSGFQVKSLIACWEKNQRGSRNIWESLANRGEIDLNYEDNYIILKNLCLFNVQNLSQLNLTLSYIIDDKTELPQFDKILGKSNARKIIEKLEVYAVVIYKYIESTQIHGNDSKQKKENIFQKKSMLGLLRAAVNSLIKGNDKKWKSLNQQESLRLYGLLMLCDHKSGAGWDSDDIGSLERSLLKERASFSGKEVAFIALMTEAFGNEQQQEKWSGFISNCIQHASQLEFSNYFCQFYKHGLGNAYIWSLLQLKYVHHMELFCLQDLLSFYLGIASKTNIDEEIWELFYELIKIKGVSRNHQEMLIMFNKKLSKRNSMNVKGDNNNNERITQIQEVIDNLEKSLEKEDIQDTVEFSYIESLGLSFEKIASEEEFIPLSVFQAGNIQHVINLIR